MSVLAIPDILETDLNVKSCPRKEQREHHALKITVTVVLMVFVLNTYVSVFLGMRVALVLVPTSMNAVKVLIHVQLMLHVETQLEPTTAHAEQATLGMEERVVTGMNAVMDHIHVHLMLHVETQTVHITVTAKLDLVGMEEVALILMNVLLELPNAHLMLPVTTALAHTLVHAILASLVMGENVHARLDMLKMGESAVT